jgi:outer membrane protein OmpA-like peptidoglycan-associated protein
VEPTEGAAEPDAGPTDATGDAKAGAKADAAAVGPTAPEPPTAPKPPADAAPETEAGAEAEASGEAEVSLGKRSRKRKGDAAADAKPRTPAEERAAWEEDPRAYEQAKAKERPWIRRWEPAPHLVELGVFGGLFRPSDEHDLYDPVTRPQDPLWKLGPDVGVRAGYFPLPPLGVEAEFSANPTRVRTITNDFAFVYGFRGHVVLQMPIYRIVPFLLGGYGLMGVRSHILILGKDVDPAFHYGGGVKMYVTKRLTVRLEARQIVSSTKAQQDSGTSHFQALAGVSFVLGRKKPVPPPVVPYVDPDRDKDGILNESDQCPDVAGLAPTGCPDTDGDGFIDKLDACPEVPGVAPDGCPLKDSDDDKIYDVEDECVFEPENYNGVDDDDGCPDELPPELVIFKGILQGIEFDLAKDTIRPVSKPVLDDAIAKLKKFPGVRVRIVGHTDDIGTPEANLELSKRRAESVKKYLVDGGIDGSRIETDGKGEAEPLVPGTDDASRAKNRRIVFDIVANEPTEIRPLKGDKKPPVDPDAEVVGAEGGEGPR